MIITVTLSDGVEQIFEFVEEFECVEGKLHIIYSDVSVTFVDSWVTIRLGK